MSDNEKEQNDVEPELEVNENVNNEKGDGVEVEEDNEEVRKNEYKKYWFLSHVSYGGHNITHLSPNKWIWCLCWYNYNKK